MVLRQLFRAVGSLTPSRSTRLLRRAERMIADAAVLRKLTSSDLLRSARSLRWRVASSSSCRRYLPEAFGLVYEAVRRGRGFEYHLVQVAAGTALVEGGIAEMQTGEGKTVTAALPAFLHALAGRGCHVVTVNDYLAARDADSIGEVLELLGISVGCIQERMRPAERRSAYAKDITYGTAKEMGFDFLRDRLTHGEAATRPSAILSSLSDTETQPIQRELHFALVDEADCVLVDDARTPLIIDLPQTVSGGQKALYEWGRHFAQQLRPGRDFVFDTERRVLALTDVGCREVLRRKKPAGLRTCTTEDLYQHVEQSLRALHMFVRDRDYVLIDRAVAIVDESTGRIMEGRKWQDGLHQAIEVKEGVALSDETRHAARMTLQTFYAQYRRLAGMTGTATPARQEFHKAYCLRTTVIPPHRPCIRMQKPTRIFLSLEAKYAAITEEVVRLRTAGRPVLIGTPSVRASEQLSMSLTERGVDHQVLNARYLESEAAIIAEAGQDGAVTIATNMAGRGTDICLSEEARQSGGLHVMATEMHSSRRIDRQLIGRAGRQGDPGSFQFWLSFDDQLLQVFDRERLARLRRSLRQVRPSEVSSGWIKLFRQAQRMLERNHVQQRRLLLAQERDRIKRYREMGLDPFLELTE